MECLTDFRKSRNASQQAMAENLGISLSLYAKIESGVRQPSRNFMKRFKRKYPDFDMNLFFAEISHDS